MMTNLIITLAIVIPLLIMSALIVRDTKRRSGKWGINFRPLACPRCGEKLFRRPRVPQSREQAMWGGITCRACSCELDKWGNERLADQSQD